MEPYKVAVALGAAGAVAWALSVVVAARENKPISTNTLIMAAVPMAAGVITGYWILTKGD